MSLFALFSLLAWVIVVGLAALKAGRFGAVFLGILLGIHTLSSISMYNNVGSWSFLWPYFQATVYLHFVLWLWPALRPLPYRALISVPASWFAAATFVAIPWAVLGGIGVPLYAAWLPYALCAVGIFQSLWHKQSDVHLSLDDISHATLTPLTLKNETPSEAQRPLKIVQITDPHLGPFMSEERLRDICQRAVDARPDLILLTGDYLTVESQYSPVYLTRALAPLKALPGKVFACRGNHDLEAPRIVAEALAQNGIQLLIDEAVVVQTEVGSVQLLSSDFHWRERAQKLSALCQRYPRLPGALRLMLLHDPGAFRHVPEGEVDLVFSGHTHGGQVGLVSLGLSWTFVRGLSSIPDHGLWAKGTNRMYVHRGTGFYGFPLRLGVPAEEGVLYVYPNHTSAARDGRLTERP